ncbi:MAG: matrixin family metalloprotease [Solirubrobacteraceae bacterium]
MKDMNRLLTVALLVAALIASASFAGAASAASRTSKTDYAGQRSRTHHPVASARAAVTSRNPVTTAAAVAERFWGATPCAGQIKIVADSPLASGLESGTDGWVTFNSSLGANNLDAPASTYTDCTISLAHWQWATWSNMESDWGMFCLTVTHEMGHLLGYKHTLRPGSVMNPVFTSDADVPAACDTTWLPGWRQPGER